MVLVLNDCCETDHCIQIPGHGREQRRVSRRRRLLRGRPVKSARVPRAAIRRAVLRAERADLRSLRQTARCPPERCADGEREAPGWLAHCEPGPLSSLSSLGPPCSLGPSGYPARGKQQVGTPPSPSCRQGAASSERWHREQAPDAQVRPAGAPAGPGTEQVRGRAELGLSWVRHGDFREADSVQRQQAPWWAQRPQSLSGGLRCTGSRAEPSWASSQETRVTSDDPRRKACEENYAHP